MRWEHSPSDLVRWYREYNEVCNSHRFDLLSQYVHPDVQVNGDVQGLEGYVSGLEAVVAAFPDYRWQLQHVVETGDWLAAHFLDSGHQKGEFLGVPATGRYVQTQEFAFYRVTGGLIAEVWVSADNLRILEQLGACRAT